MFSSCIGRDGTPHGILEILVRLQITMTAVGRQLSKRYWYGMKKSLVCTGVSVYCARERTGVGCDQDQANEAMGLPSRSRTYQGLVKRRP